jgi:uncharacterized protein YceH (UPF0502 family)
MSDDTIGASVQTPDTWPVLSVNERRVLGVLVEKAKTTPDAYPLSLNALVTGSNQKSNREPLLDLNDLDVEEALSTCQKKGLVFKITGGRVERYKHNLYEAWRVNKVEIAVLGELLLRGPQTEGELRSRASRMEPIADLDAMRTTLKALATRGLVVYLTPEGRRGTTVTHGFHFPQEVERLRTVNPGEDDGEHHRPAPAPIAPAADSGRLAALEAQCNSLQTEVAALKTAMADLVTQLRGLKDALGA